MLWMKRKWYFSIGFLIVAFRTIFYITKNCKLPPPVNRFLWKIYKTGLLILFKKYFLIDTENEYVISGLQLIDNF